MVLRTATPVAFLGSLAAVVLLGCPAPEETPPPAPDWRDPPKVTLSLERGVVSATGAAKEDTLTFGADRAGSVRVLLGPGCDGKEVAGSRPVAEGTKISIGIRAEAELAVEGEHVLSACFSATDQGQARAAVSLRVDNTAPSLSITPLAGTPQCRAPYVTFLCSDCASVAYAFEPEVAFGTGGVVERGNRYQGFAIAVPLDATVYFRGIDRAGNQTELLAAAYPKAQAEIAVESLNHAAISNNFNSTQRTMDVTLRGTPGSSVSVRWDTGACSSGQVVATGTLDGTGAGVVSVPASSLDWTRHTVATNIFDHPLRVCSVPPGGCGIDTPLVIRRKDQSLGWSAEAPAGTAQAIAPWPAETKLLYLDAAVDDAAASAQVTTRLSNFYVLGIPAQVAFEADGARIAFAVPLPENTLVDVQFAPTDLRDEAGNPLAPYSTYVNTSAGTRWHPFGQKTFTATAETVTDDRTGLIWQRWYASNLYWHEAQAYCHQLGTNVYAGRADWRVPTARELLSLLDPGASQTGQPTFLNTTFNWSGGRYWSSTAIPSSSWVWTVDFGGSVPTSENRFGLRTVRCVAGAPDSGAPRNFERVSFDGSGFVLDPAGPIVRETSSGVYWEQLPDPTFRNSADAINSCTGTRHALSDWTLPTAAHFMTLHQLDLSSSPRLDFTPFTADSASFYWVSRPAQYGVRPLDAALNLPSSTPVWCVRQ